jgi:apolipoprotein N-acyltransferase
MPAQIFCSKCGQAISGAPTPASMATPAPSPQSSISPASQPAQTSPSAGFARPSRVARHIGVLGALWIAFSVLRLIPGVALVAFGHRRFPFMFMPVPEHMRLFLAPFLGAIGLLISAFAIAGVIAGWGLLAHSPWARMLAIILGCISLIHPPFGTALGIYTLWVLIPERAEAEYQRLAKVS